MAQLVVGVAAAAALGPLGLGLMSGGTAFVAATTVYSMLQGPQRVQGPRLDDLKAPAASYGSPIAYIIGSPRVPGVVAWASDKREISHTESQGKGGGGVETTSYTYEIDVLYVLSINQLAGVRRVWANGELVWTIADDADAESLAASKQTEKWRELRVYTGSSGQLPDPTYEAAVGIDNAPAYRGRGCVFIEGLQLGGSGQLPVLTFEVARVFGAGSVTEDTLPVLHDTSRYGAGTLFVDSDATAYLHTKNTLRDSQGTTVSIYAFTEDAVTFVNSFETPNMNRVAPVASNENVSISVRNLGVVKNEWALTSNLGATLESFVIDNEDIPPTVWAYRDGALFGAGQTDDSASSSIYRIVGGSVTHQVSTWGVQSLVCDGVYLYAQIRRSGGGAVQVYDAATMALLQTITTPFVSQETLLLLDDADTLYFVGQHFSVDPGSIYQRVGSDWMLVTNQLDLAKPNTQSTPLDRLAIRGGILYRYLTPQVLTPQWLGDGHLYRAQLARGLAPEPLDTVVQRLCERTGLLTADDIDVTALASDSVRSMAVSQVSTTRQVLEILMAGYFFEAAEAEKIRFVKRGGASVATIPYEDLGASASEPVEPLPLKRVNDIEMPAQITVRYSNVSNDYQDGSESGDRLVTQSTRTEMVELPLGLTPQEAKRLADARTMDVAAGMIAIGPIAVTREYARLEPTDVVTLTGPTGSTYRARLLKCTDSAGVRAFEAALDDASAIVSGALTDDGYTSTSLVRAIGDTALELLDIPILRDADNDPGYYAAMRGTGRWPGAVLMESADDVTFVEDGSVQRQAVMGTATTALGDWAGGWVFDEANTVTVDVGDGELSSITRDTLLAGSDNAMLLGDEIIRFRTATLVSAGVYTLSGLLRGQRGTEWAMGLHEVGERAVLLGTAGTLRVARQAGELGTEYHHRAVTIGRSTSSAQSETITPTGIGLKPLAPVGLRAEVSDDGGATVTWSRRSRLSTRLFATTGVPLGEASESYDVELYDGSALVSTDTVTQAQWSASTLHAVASLVAPAWGLLSIGGELVGVRDDALGDYTTSKRLIRFSPAGAQVAVSDVLGQEVYQFVANGDDLYVATAEYNSGTPVTYKSTKVQRLVRTDLSTVAATYTSAVAGDVAGIAHDGTNVWMSERTSGNLRKLNASTLAAVNTYALDAGITAMQHDSGSLWIVRPDSDQVIEWDVATTAEVQRFTVVTAPHDVLIANGLAFVFGASKVGVYDTADGSLVAEHDVQAGSLLAGRALRLFGDYVAVADVSGADSVVFLDATTGGYVRRASVSDPEIVFVCGSSGSTLYLASRRSGQSLDVGGYELATADLSGHTVKVYQNSAIVGRGYPASIDL